MKALTLWRPWPWAIFHARTPKRIENRPWKPWRSVIGQRIALHAGTTMDLDSVPSLLEAGGCADAPSCIAKGKAMTAEGIIGVVTVRGYIATEMEAAALGQERWWSGPFAWVLDDVVALKEAIPCAGMQGLWDLPPAVEAELRGRLG